MGEAPLLLYPGRIYLEAAPAANGGPALSGKRFRARFMRAGRVRAAGNRPGRIVLHPAALHDAVARGLFTGRPMFLDHSRTREHPSLRNMAAVILRAKYDAEEQAIYGEFRLYANAAGRLVGELLRELAAGAAAGEPVPDVGLSAVFWPDSGSTGSPGGEGTLHVRRILYVESVDFVFEPAADGRVLTAFDRQLTPIIQQGDSKMREQTTVDETPAVTGRQMATADQAAAASGGREWLAALRAQTVEAVLAGSGLPQPTRERLAAGRYRSPAELQQAITQARAELAALQEQQVVQLDGDAPRGTFGSSRVQGMRSGREEMANALAWLFGVRDAERPAPELRDVRRVYHLMTGDYEWRGVYRPERVMLAGATTSDLANVAADAMNKVIVQQWSRLTFWRWYERVAWPTPNDGSVQDMQWTVLGGVSNLPAVDEKGTYTELDVDDVAETDSFVKYGGYVGLTLEMIRNSDIQRMQAIPRALAVAAVRTRSAQVAAIFTANGGVGPTLSQDSTALFHANHSNLQTTAFGTDATAWRAARAECFNQTELNSGKKLGVFPRYWLGPADLYDTALSVFGYGEGMPTSYAPEAQDRGFADPRPIPLAVPDWTDSNDWAYIVDPEVFPVIHISYAQAPQGGVHPEPELFTVSSPTAGLVFTNDTLPIKVRDWFAVGVNGYRGIGKRNVA